MKYIIYWYFYVSSLGSGDIAGTIEVTDKTVKSYLYGIGYITWDIIEVERSADENKFFTGTYRLKSEDLESIMIIGSETIEHHIATDEPVHITMKRKKI